MNEHSNDSVRLLYRISRDFLLILCSALVYIIFHLTFDVFDFQNKTGFFCSDQDLYYPYKKSYVPTKVLLLYISTLMPLVTFTITEAFWNNSGVIRLFGFNFPLWIPQTYNRMVQYVFGFYLQMSVMLLPKFFDVPHFLRPHFMTVCQPIIGRNLTCEEITDPNEFITDYFCKGIGFDKDQIQNVYWTFPSGHSSCSFYTSVYLVLYLQHKLRTRKTKEFKLILQFLLLLLAMGVSITRIQDHHHHGVDVISGALLGIIAAYYVHTHITKHFPAIRDITGFTNHGVENNNFEGIDINVQPK